MPPALSEPECVAGRWEVVVETLKLASGYLFAFFYTLLVGLAVRPPLPRGAGETPDLAEHRGDVWDL